MTSDAFNHVIRFAGIERHKHELLQNLERRTERGSMTEAASGCQDA